MRSEIFRGRYLFHFHTHATDGRPSIADYFDQACAHRLDRLIFLEHIRRCPTYDVLAYRQEVAACARTRGVSAFLGFEAKLLPDGELDIASEHAACADVLGLAEHGFPPDLGLLRSAFVTATANYRERYPDKELVWVHPGTWFKKHRCLDERQADYLEMVAAAEGLGLRIEHNFRHGLIPRGLIEAVAPPNLVFGADAHRLEDVHATLAMLDGPSRPGPTTSWGSPP